MESTSEERAPFINTRCRLQRIKDAKFFAGWVKDFTQSELSVKLSTKTMLAIGDAFSIEVHGTDRSAIFNARITSQENDDVVLGIHEQVRFMPARERARLCVEGISGVFNHNGVDTPFSVSDVSLAGCGLVAPYAVQRGTKLYLEVDTAQGPIKCSGEVRYCKPDIEIPGAYRLGMSLDTMSRLEMARWAKLFEFYSAA